MIVVKASDVPLWGMPVELFFRESKRGRVRVSERELESLKFLREVENSRVGKREISTGKEPRGLEGAPIPVSRHAAHNGVLGLVVDIGHGYFRSCRAAAAALCAGAPAARLESAAPSLVVVPAAGAGSGEGAVGVEASVLVEGDVMQRVRGTENVAAASTMMAAHEEGELGAACRGVTEGRGVIRLMSVSIRGSGARRSENEEWLTFQWSRVGRPVTFSNVSWLHSSVTTRVTPCEMASSRRHLLGVASEA